MQPHAFFDLLLHTDAELEDHFGSSLYERHTLHEWPLSCVQRLDFADGRRMVYKSQSGPTVETEFYRHASSPALSSIEVLHHEGPYSSLVMEYLDAPRLWDLHLAGEDLLRIGKALKDEIHRVQGAFPVYLNIRTWQRWQVVMAEMVANLRRLVQTAEFACVTSVMVDTVERAAVSPAVLDVYEQPVGLVHGDLAGDNVFVLPGGGYRIIDWQRPLMGPVDLDLANLADSFDIDPRLWVGPGVATAFSLLRIQWLVEAAIRWFPAGKGTYDDSIAKIIAQL
jgi:hypothetical protein